MKKRVCCFLLLAFLVLIPLCACGGDPSSAGTDTAGGGSETEETVIVPVTTGTPVLIDPDDFNLVEENSYATVKTNAYMEADARSYVVLNSETTGQARYDKAQYPRLKKLADGSYILFWQYGTYGQHIYYARSNDLVNWSAPVVLYNSANYKYKNESGAEVRTYFVNCDAAVLPDGTIFTVVAARESGDYIAAPQNAGIYACVSHDNGATFEKPYKIYTGVNWEPSVLVLPDGEIQVFFSQVSPGITYWGYRSDRNSTGTGMIVSKDGGKTWTPNVTDAPYQAKIAAQQYIMELEGKPCFTDQMFVATLLYDGTVAGACEAKQEDKSVFCVSIVRTDAAWSEEIAYDKEGPADRTDALCVGAGPYILKMPSGEVLLNYGVNSRISYLRVGDGAAREWNEPTTAFEAAGYWGSIEVTGNNRVTGVFPVVAAKDSILIKNFYLNHAITARPAPISVDGKNSDDWKDVTDALFLGNGGQAQATLRAAYHKGELSLLCERRDKSLTDLDKTYVYLADTAGTFYRFVIDREGNVTLERGGATFSPVSLPFAFASSVITGADGGMVTEIRIALSDFGFSGRSGCMANLMLLNSDADGSSAKYSISGTDLYDASTWLNIHFAGEENGSAPLAEGAAATTTPEGNMPTDGAPVLRVNEAFVKEGRLCGANGSEIRTGTSDGESYASLVITDPYDPFVSLVCGDVDASKYKYALIRYRTNEDAGGNRGLDLFFAAGNMAEFAYTAQAMEGTSMVKDGRWHTAVIDLTGNAGYTGMLKTFRLDPFDGSNANKGDTFDLCWVAFVESYAEALPYMD